MQVWAPSTWTVIHSYPTTYNNKDTKKTKRLLSLILLLLCCMDCRKNAVKEIKKIPIDKYLKNNESLFLWSWTLHDSVNRRLEKQGRPYQEAKDWYFSRIGLFGNCIWRMIHSFAVTYTPNLAKEYKEMIFLLIELSCCPEWKKTGTNILEKCSIDKYLESNETLFNWTYRYHDSVNQSLGKVSPDYKKTKDWYFNQLGINHNSDEKCNSCSV